MRHLKNQKLAHLSTRILPIAVVPRNAGTVLDLDAKLRAFVRQVLSSVCREDSLLCRLQLCFFLQLQQSSPWRTKTQNFRQKNTFLDYRFLPLTHTHTTELPKRDPEPEFRANLIHTRRATADLAHTKNKQQPAATTKKQCLLRSLCWRLRVRAGGVHKKRLCIFELENIKSIAFKLKTSSPINGHHSYFFSYESVHIIIIILSYYD